MIIQNTHIEINLKNLEHNLNFIRSKISEKTKILCVVKAFGYGSEPIEIAKRLEDNKVDYLAVAVIDILESSILLVSLTNFISSLV